MDVVGGTEATYWDTDTFVSPYGFPNTDIRLQFDTIPSNIADWLVKSRDPVSTYFVPEPLTLFGLFAGVSGLAGYIRRRRLA